MTYSFLATRSQPGDPIAQEVAIPASFGEFDFGDKLKVPKKPLAITVSKPKHGLPDLIQGPYTYIIASERLRDLFEELEPDHVQFIPVDVRHQSKTLATYSFVQILDNIDAIDWSKSKLEHYPEDKYAITKLTKLVLDPKASGGRQVFRIQGIDARLAVSETFRKRTSDEGMTGMEFTPLDKFKMP